MTFIKKVINSDPGDVDHVGGNNWDTLDDYFDNVATGLTARINSDTYFRSNRFWIRNPADTFSYKFVAAAIAANRTITLPLLTADATMAVLELYQRFTKTIDITGDPGTDEVLQLVNLSNTVGESAGINFNLNDSGSAEANYGSIYTGITANTAGAQTGFLSVWLKQAGASKNVIKFDTGGMLLRLDTQNLLTIWRENNVVSNKVGLDFALNDSLNNKTTYAAIRASITDNTDASEDADFILSNMIAGGLADQVRLGLNGVGIGANLRARLSDVGLTAIRSITFQDADTKVAGIDNAQTFSLANTFTKSIMANGGLNITHVSKTANYTLTADDGIIRADASAGAFTLTLPAAASNTKKVYTIIRTDILASTNLLTIDGNASETIDGNLTYILSPAESVEILCDGSNWIVTQRTDVSAESGSYFLKNSTNNRRYVAGLNSGNNALLTSTTSPAANTLWAIPFYVSKVTKFDTISFEVTTLVAAKSGRCGIYADNGNCYPGALIFDGGAVSVATTGVKDTTITAGVQILQPGLYWLTWETDAGATLMIRILPGAGTCISFAGLANTMGTTGGGFAYSVAHTFGALPNPYTGGGTIITTPSAVGSPIPAVALRAI